jgi:putative acetyltransferase
VFVRRERVDDGPDVRRVNELAFGQPLEAALVERLRAACPDAVSLVAEDDGTVVGHILFTPVTIDGHEDVVGMGLAPMAVAPARQRQGIGSALVRAGLTILGERGCPFVIVLGHPGYYPRFGFVPASQHGITSQWEGIPDDAFMMLVLRGDALRGVAGVARYRPEFNEA